MNNDLINEFFFYKVINHNPFLSKRRNKDYDQSSFAMAVDVRYMVYVHAIAIARDR